VLVRPWKLLVLLVLLPEDVLVRRTKLLLPLPVVRVLLLLLEVGRLAAIEGRRCQLAWRRVIGWRQPGMWVWLHVWSPGVEGRTCSVAAPEGRGEWCAGRWGGMEDCRGRGMRDLSKKRQRLVGATSAGRQASPASVE
jgi:hypothetical protein